MPDVTPSAPLAQGGLWAGPDGTEWVNPHKVGSIPSDIGSHRPSTQYNPPDGWDLISLLAFHRLHWDRSLHSFHSHYIFRYPPLGTSLRLVSYQMKSVSSHILTCLIIQITNSKPQFPNNPNQYEQEA